jgi:hypothetical protein
MTGSNQLKVNSKLYSGIGVQSLKVSAVAEKFRGQLSSEFSMKHHCIDFRDIPTTQKTAESSGCCTIQKS